MLYVCARARLLRRWQKQREDGGGSLERCCDVCWYCGACLRPLPPPPHTIATERGLNGSCHSSPFGPRPPPPFPHRSHTVARGRRRPSGPAEIPTAKRRPALFAPAKDRWHLFCDSGCLPSRWGRLAASRRPQNSMRKIQLLWSAY